GWRNDHVTEDEASLPNPYDIFWNTKYRGKTHLLDDYREPICMALLRKGITDVNTDDPNALEMAKTDLQQLVDLVGLKFDTNDYTDLPDGGAWLHQSWSGDLVSAQYHLARGTSTRGTRSWSSARRPTQPGTAHTNRYRRVSSRAGTRPSIGSSRRARRRERAGRLGGVWYPRWFWPSFTFPGTVWLLLLFLLPF